MATPRGPGRKWRFRLNDATTLEVTTPLRATEKQVRRRGRMSLVLGTVVAALMLSAVASADKLEADADALATSTPAGNELAANQQPGTTAEYNLSAAVDETGNPSDDVFAAAGDTVVVTIARAGDWLASLGGSPASFSFTSYDSNQAGTIRVTVPCGTTPGTSKVMTAVLTAGASSNGKTLSPNSQTLQYTITAQGSDAALCAPANAAPTVDAGGPYSGAEGSSVSLNGTVTDPDAGDTVTTSWTYSVDSADPGTTCSFGNAAAVDTTVTCTDDGTFTLTLTADDGVNPAVASTASLVLSNANPAITTASFGAGSPPHLSCGTNNASLAVSFTDAGSNDTHEADVDWDGDTPPVYDQNDDPFTSGGSIGHTYSGGSHTAKVKVTDDDGGESSVASATVVVDYDTSGILQPVNDTRNGQQPSVFKYKSTIPVKIRVTDCDGSVVSNLAPTVSFRTLSGNPPAGGTEEAASTVPPTDGTTMRWDSVAQQYIYNLATKQLGTDSSATYRITVTIQAGQTVYADIGVKP